jgi:hypothetical protein
MTPVLPSVCCQRVVDGARALGERRYVYTPEGSIGS